MDKRPQIISYEQIDVLMGSFKLPIQNHLDSMTFAIEIANCQRDADYKWHKEQISLTSEEIEKGLLTYEEMDKAYCLADLHQDTLGHEAVANAQLQKILDLLK